MKSIHGFVVATAVAAVLAGCATTPEDIPELENARAAVSKVEASPRAGVAAQDVAEARRALDRATRLAEGRANRVEMNHEARVARTHAQIAEERILAAEAREEIGRGKEERQQVLLQVREREARARELEAQAAQERAEESERRAVSLQDELQELQAKPTPRGMVVTLRDVLFETDKAELQPGAMPTLAKVAEVLREASDRTVVIEGHTDSVGPAEYNQQLSERRARAVEDALISQGVPAEQITSRGLGESTPVAPNETAAGRQQNRRVELVFAEDEARAGGGG